MSYLGDFTAGITLDHKFTTRSFSTGAPATLSSGAISIYKDNSTTQSTSGVTLSLDFDSVTGLNNIRIDTSSDGTFYSAGSNFHIVITTGTVSAVSVVGETVGSFSIQNRPSTTALTAARTEPTQGAPAVNASALSKLDYLYKAWRNKVTQDATTYKLYADDAATVDHKSTVSDDSTTFTRGEIAAGP